VKKDRQRTAVVILRMEEQGAGLLISVRLNADIGQLSSEREAKYADPEEALEAIRRFVRSFVSPSPA